MTALFVDQLTVIDFSFFDPQRGIVGESWIMDVELAGTLDDNGMVFDFAHVKKQIKQHVDQLVDHKFVFPEQLHNTTIKEEDQRLLIEAKTPHGLFQHISPSQAVALIPSDVIDTHTVTPFIEKSLRSILPTNVTSLKVTLRNEEINGSYYHYSHGLKKHFGDCQRIAHGHRSKIHIFKNNERCVQLEQQVAEQWRDIYLITDEDIQSELVIDQVAHYQVAYQANQGEFQLTIPVSCCDRMVTDTTVELIAEHLAERLKKQYPNDTIKVKAFEGVQKGAIAVG